MSDLVGLNVQTPSFTGTLSSLMQLKQQKQQLDLGQQAVQQGALETKKQQALQDFYKDFDPDEAMGEDGSIDLNKVFSHKKFQSAGNAKPLIADTLINIKTKQLQATQALATLNGTLVQQFGTGLGALLSDPDVVADKTDPQTGINPGREKVTEFMQQFGGLDASHKKIADMYGLIANHAPIGKLASGLKTIQLQAQSASEQQAQQNPRTGAIDNGPSIILTNTDVPTGAVTQTGSIAKGIGPSVITAPSGQPGTVTNNGRTFTPIGSTNPLAHERGTYRTAADDAPPPTAPATVQDNYSKAVTAANDHVQQVREADEHYRTNVDISNKIRELSRTTLTGPAVSKLKSLVGASDFQELGAYLDRQAAQLQTAMNLPHTNQGQEAARDISGNTSYTPKAIQEKNDFNQSLVEGFHAYRKGLEKVGGLSGNGSPVAINNFKSAWAENFDPNVFRAKAAFSRSKDEGNAFINTLSPEDAARMLKDKKALEALEKGQMP